VNAEKWDAKLKRWGDAVLSPLGALVGLAPPNKAPTPQTEI